MADPALARGLDELRIELARLKAEQRVLADLATGYERWLGMVRPDSAEVDPPATIGSWGLIGDSGDPDSGVGGDQSAVHQSSGGAVASGTTMSVAGDDASVAEASDDVDEASPGSEQGGADPASAGGLPATGQARLDDAPDEPGVDDDDSTTSSRVDELIQRERARWRASAAAAPIIGSSDDAGPAKSIVGLLRWGVAPARR